MATWFTGLPRNARSRYLNEDPSAGGVGIAGVTVEDEGVGVGTPAGISTINFVGAGVVATAVGAIATVTIAGGIAGITVAEEGVAVGTPSGITSVNFVGAGVTATGVGANATVTVVGTITTELLNVQVGGNQTTINWDVDSGTTLTNNPVGQTNVTLFDPAPYVYFGAGTRLANSGAGSCTVGSAASTLNSFQGAAYGHKALAGGIALRQKPCAFGADSTANFDFSCAFGPNTVCNSLESVCVGNTATATPGSDQSTVVGTRSQSRILNGVAIGNGALANTWVLGASSPFCLGLNTTAVPVGNVVTMAGSRLRIRINGVNYCMALYNDF